MIDRRPAIDDLVDNAVLLSTEAQAHCATLVKGASWDVDFSGQGTLTFTADDAVNGEPAVSMRAHFLGTFDPHEHMWQWAWEAEAEYSEAVTQAARQVREYGNHQGINALTTGDFSTDADTAFRLVLAAKDITGIYTHYPARIGGGSIAWILVEHPSLELGEPRIQRIVGSFAKGLEVTKVNDHRRALQAYARHRRFPLWEEHGAVRILTEDGYADIQFNEDNQIIDCDMHQPLSPEASRQWAEAQSALSHEVPEPEPVPEEPEVQAEPEPVPEEPVLEEPVQEVPEIEPAPASEPEPELKPQKKGLLARLLGKK